jgi:histidinol dehydrogenase
MLMRRISLEAISPAERSALVRRAAVPDPEIREGAAAIVGSIQHGGDTALQEANRRFGGGHSNGVLRLDPQLLDHSFAGLPNEVVDALRAAEGNIRRCHIPQRPEDSGIEVAPGVTVSRLWSPLQRVGVYVPGGRAAYPSSLLMGVIPAQVAGVAQVAVASPADAAGRVDPVVMGAAGMLGIDEFYVTGGAQAIGALAFGTESIDRVDKIVGPGGPWVTAAKLAVYGICGVDLPAGPSEAIVMVDADADPRLAAADLLCQAEHGPDSPIVLIAIGDAVIDRVLEEAETQAADLEREEIIRSSLEGFGLAVAAPDLDEALRFADQWAPEHLTLHTADAGKHAERVPSAGSIFVGRWTPESAGDYASGANHVLPTGGLARSHGPLAVEDFGSWRQVQELTREGLSRLAPTIRSLAIAEGLTAHAHAVDVRFEDGT